MSDDFFGGIGVAIDLKGLVLAAISSWYHYYAAFVTSNFILVFIRFWTVLSLGRGREGGIVHDRYIDDTAAFVRDCTIYIRYWIAYVRRLDNNRLLC